MSATVRCWSPVVLCLGAVVTFGGCGRSSAIQVTPTSGVVLMDGEPVEGVSVVLQQAGLSMVASGKTDAEGRFKLSTYGRFDGAPVGDCVATVTAIGEDISTFQQEVPIVDNSSIADVDERVRANREAFGARREKIKQMERERKSKNKKQPVIVPKRYNDPKTSNLKFTISPSKTNEIQIALTK